jgi:hypothetical protein
MEQTVKMGYTLLWLSGLSAVLLTLAGNQSGPCESKFPLNQ